MSPVRAFLLLLALLVLAGVVLWVTTRPDRAEPIRMERPQATGESQGTQPQAESASRPKRTTKAEAKEIFRKLNRAALQAYRRRDIDAIPMIWTGGSPVRSTAKREIRRLLRESVLVRTQFNTKKLSVRSITSSQIKLIQVVIIDPRFVTESGEEITASDARDRDTVKWMLRKKGGHWFIHNARVIDRSRLDPAGEH